MANKDFVLVLGGHGTIGRHLQKLLKKQGSRFLAPTKSYLNLLNLTEVMYRLNELNPTVIINLAAKKTNIKMNAEHPLTIFQETLDINLNLLKAASAIDCKPNKIVNIISSCAYGENELLIEDKFFEGNVNASIRSHGEAKKMVYLAGQYYRKECSLNVVSVALNNIYGGCNWSKPDELKVCDALIKKFVDAKLDNTFMASMYGTGAPRREFLYYKDAAEGILLASQKYNDAQLLNLGCGYDISIKQLAEGIRLAVGYKGELHWDRTKPDGQMKKLFNVDKQHTCLDWFPPTSLAEGVQETIDEYTMYRS